MLASAALPTSSLLPDGNHAIGTMFLLRKNGIFLVGAAHSPIRAQPHCRWNEWPLGISVWKSPTEQQELPLFEERFGLRVPRFNFRLNHLAPDRLDDIMAYKLDPIVAAAAFPAATIVDLPSNTELASTGTAATVFGYPDRAEKLKWPYNPPTSASGTVLGPAGALLLASCPIDVGHSGGPTFDTDGNLVGMAIGTTDDGACQIVPTRVLVDFLT